MADLAIIDYGAGNLGSVQKIFSLIGEDAKIISTPEEVLAADRIVLPGVGAAGKAIKKLERMGLIEALNEAVRRKARPFLGICLGMQLVGRSLSEFGEFSGFGWIEGDVVHLDNLLGVGNRVPHMGWSQVDVFESGEEMFSSVRGNGEFYFSHSYGYSVEKTEKVVAVTKDYGVPIVAAIISETVFATQFHPEKSQINGERLLASFLDWKP